MVIEVKYNGLGKLGCQFFLIVANVPSLAMA